MSIEQQMKLLRQELEKLPTNHQMSQAEELEAEALISWLDKYFYWKTGDMLVAEVPAEKLDQLGWV